MKASKLSVIAIVAISMGLFSCNKEDAPIAPQNSNNESKTITEESLEQAKLDKVITFRVLATPQQIKREGGSSYLTGEIQITYSDGLTATAELSNMVYTGSAKGFTLFKNQVIADPLPANAPSRSIVIVGTGTYQGKVYEDHVTIYQGGGL